MLKPMEMIQVLIHWQFRNGVWKVLPCSVQLRSLVIPLVNLYLCGFFCLCRYKKKKRQKKTSRFWLELKWFLSIFFFSTGNSGFFIPSFGPIPFLRSAGWQQFGYIQLFLQSIVHLPCILLYCVFLELCFHIYFFPFCEMVLKTWGHQVVKVYVFTSWCPTEGMSRNLKQHW